MKIKRSNPLFARFFRGNTLASAVVVTLAGFAIQPSAQAANLYWDTNAATAGSGNAAGTWDTGTNWSTDSTGLSATSAWVNNESAVFSAGTDGTGGYTVTLAGTISTPSILVEEAGAKTIAGGTITIGGGSINTAGAGNGNVFTISSILAGSGGLTVAGNGDMSDSGGGSGGMLALSGANTFTGDMTITAGLVRLNSGFGDAANKIILNGGGIIDNSLSVTTTRNIEVGASGGTIRLWGGATTNLNGAFTGSGTVKHTDGGTLRLGGEGSAFTGTLTNARGNLYLVSTNWTNTSVVQTDGGNVLYIPTAGTTTIKSLISDRDVNVSAGARLNIATGTYTTVGAGVDYNGFWAQGAGALTSSSGTLTVTNGLATGNLTTTDNQIKLKIENFDGVTPLAVVKNNRNSMVFDQPNTYSGGTTINGGRLQAGNLSAYGTGAVTINTDGQAYLATAGTYANNFVINGNGTTEAAGQLGAIRFQGNTVSGSINVASAARIVAYGTSGTHTGALTGTAALNLNLAASPGTLNFTGTTSGYSGAMTLNAGTLNIGASGLGGELTVSGSTATSTGTTVTTTGSTANVTGAIVGNVTVNGGTASADGATAIATAGGGTLTVGGLIGGNAIVNPGTTTVLNGGTATASGGSLTINGGVTGNVTVADGATLGGESAIAGTLNLGATIGSTLRIKANTVGALSAATVNLAGINTVVLDTLPSVSGPFTVLSYTTLAIGDETNFVVPSGVYRGNPQVQHDIGGSQFTLELNSALRTWNGSVTTDWNTIDTNWDEGDFKFYSGDDVVFTDNGVGSVSLVGSLAPLSITLQNTVGSDYTFQGSGALVGATGLSMTGGGNLTLGGTGVNTFTGGISVGSGILTMGKQSALGANSGVTVASGARVNLNGQSAGGLATGGYAWTIAGDGGDGAGGVGAITNSGTDSYGSSGLKSLTLSGNAEIGGSNGRFDVGRHEAAGTSGTINGGGFTLTKVGTNAIVFRAPASNITYVVNAGQLTFEEYDTASGTNPITVNAGTLGSYNNRTMPNDVSFTTAGNTLVSQAGTGTWGGAITLGGNTTFTTSGNLVIDGSLAGSGNITRTGANTLVLQNTGASYSGRIANNSGTLRIESASATGTYAGADAITMATGTTLQGGTITAQATATVGNSTQGILLSNGGAAAGGVNFDTGTGNVLTVNSPITSTGAFASNLIKTNTTGSLVFNQNVNISGKTSSNGGTQTFNGNLVLGTGSGFEVGSAVVSNINSPTLTVPGGILAWTGTTNIAIGTGTIGRLTLQEGSNQPHTVNHSAGALTVATDIRLGHWGGGVACVYNISGGSLNQPDTVTSPTNEGQANLFIGIDGFGNLNISGTGVVNTTSLVVNGRGGTTADTVNLTGGRLNIGRWGIRNPGTSFVNLGGGTVGAWGSDWSSSTPMALTGTGGNVIIDTLDSVDGVTARNISLTGVLSGTGGLTKKGVGGLSLSNAGTTSFTGTAKVEGGSLYLNAGVADDATVWAVAGGTVQPGTFSAAGTATAATLNLDGGTAGFRLGTSSDKFTVPNLTVTSASKIAVYPATGFALNTPYTVVDYAGAVGGLGVAGGLSLANPHLTGSIVDDMTNTLVTVTITGADAVLWKGDVNGTWDVESTSNWVLASNNATSSIYYNSDSVRLTDLGLAQPTITLAGAVTPGSVSVENTSGTYTLQGTAIGGGASLTKTGAGNLTLLNDNSYTGTTSLSGGGTVTVGTGGTVGTLGGTGNIELSSTTLAFNRSNAQTLDRSVTGTSGTLVKNGTNTLTMSAANNTCDIVINNGTLAARGGGWATSFAANRTITVNAPGILDTTTHALNGLGGGSRPNYIVINEDAIWKLNNEQQLPNISLTLTAGIVNGPGDVRGGGTITTVAHATKSSQINCPVNNGNGGVTFNVADGAVATDLALTGNMGGGNANTKTGPGTLVLSGVENTYSGGTNVNGGTLEVASVADQVLPTDGDDYATGGIGSGYLGIANDATFRYTGTTAETTVRPLWIDTGAQTKTVDIVSATGDVTFSSTAGNINKPFTKTGAGALTLNDVIAPGAAVTVAAGTLTLGGTNTYTGDTTVTGGTLVIDGDSISDDGKLVIDGGVVKVTNNETVQKLFFGAAEQAIGTYGATGSGATNIDDIHFSGTGTGIVTVTGAGYSSWITTFGLAVGDQGAAADPDGDGISNGVEWVLGGNPATGMDTAKLPTVSTTGVNLIFTFKRDQDSKVAGTSVAIEVGTSLAGWPTVYTVGNDTAGSSAGVTVTDNLDGTDTITLTVAQAPDAAKFARLKVSID